MILWMILGALIMWIILRRPYPVDFLLALLVYIVMLSFKRNREPL